MTPLILALPGNERLAADLADRLGAELGGLETRRFPDGETYVRLLTDVTDRSVIVVCTLARPDEQFLGLIYVARTARSLGAARLTLAAPYLAYMRQDIAFRPGEAVTSAVFAALLSQAFDALVTVDPHLHRHKSLSAIYDIPALALRAAPLLGDWIGRTVERPLIVGPDAESEQWAAEVAAQAGAPYVVLRKDRRGDRDVTVALPDLAAWRDRQPVLVDDIVSSGQTMIAACQALVAEGFPRPVCVAVHALFAREALERLSTVAQRIVSTDTVPHPTNAIPIAPLLAAALRSPIAG